MSARNFVAALITETTKLRQHLPNDDGSLGGLMKNTKNTTYTVRWFITIFIGLVFAGSGAAKLMGDPIFTSYFEEFGIPLLYMRVLGVIELLGAVALCVPKLARYANLGFLTIAIGATVMHLIYDKPIAALLPLALASAAVIVVWGTPGHPVKDPEPKVLLPPEPSSSAESSPSTVPTGQH
jgi:putative oxidoreductase